MTSTPSMPGSDPGQDPRRQQSQPGQAPEPRQGAAAQQPQAPASSAGAVDLSQLQNAGATPGAGQPPAGAAGGAPLGSWAKSVDEEGFQDLLQLSTRVPVIVLVSSPRVQGGEGLRTRLVQAVDGQQGRMVLGVVDGDAHPRIAQALQVQQVPAVFAVIGGRPMPLFVGDVDDTQIKALLEELTTLAVQQGMAGTVPPFSAEGADGETPSRFEEAEDALAEERYDDAAAIYEKALKENPADDEAAVGLHRTRLLERVLKMDGQKVREAAAEHPEDVQAQIDVADLDLVGGHVDDAFNRLIAFIARHHGDEREAARAQLVDLFGVVGQQDPRVIAARRRLASSLF